MINRTFKFIWDMGGLLMELCYPDCGEGGETTRTFESLSKEDKSYCSDFRDAWISEMKHEIPPPLCTSSTSVPVYPYPSSSSAPEPEPDEI